MSMFANIGSAITSGGESFMQYAKKQMGFGPQDPTPVSEQNANKAQNPQNDSGFDFSFGGTATQGGIPQDLQMQMAQADASYRGGQRQALDPSITALYSPFNTQQNEQNDVQRFGGYAGF